MSTILLRSLVFLSVFVSIGDAAVTGSPATVVSPSLPQTAGQDVTTPSPPAGLGSIGLTDVQSSTGCFNYFNSKDGCVSANGKNNCRPKVSTAVVHQFSASDPEILGNTGAPQPALGPNALTPPTTNGGLSPGTPNTVSLPNAALLQASLSANPALKTLRRRQNPLVSTSSSKATTSSTPSQKALGSQSNNLTPLTSAANSSASTSGGICGNYNSDADLAVCLWSGSDPTGSDSKQSGWLNTILQRTGSNLPPIIARVADGCNFDTKSPAVGCSQIYLSKKAFMALNPSPEEITAEILKGSVTWDLLVD
ncbi:expressed protein [Phakopsora pachyrhizi]|uniref:Expressed protein n=1 Tax=Phakopsora pachyrhizi TaxID=170000 RepID=A0AAV0BSC9_PHAPC|nr:expressed protein [Phakopsora pachyrhizi]